MLEAGRSGREFTRTIPVRNELPQSSGGIEVERGIRRIEGMIDNITRPERSYPYLMTVPGHCPRITESVGPDASEVPQGFIQFKATSELVKKLEASGWCNVGA